MSISLQRLPLAFVYAVWSGVGLVGIGFIAAGVVVLQLYGRSSH
jgi:multidrug transporter EmrE-like cation transporter